MNTESQESNTFNVQEPIQNSVVRNSTNIQNIREEMNRIESKFNKIESDIEEVDNKVRGLENNDLLRITKDFNVKKLFLLFVSVLSLLIGSELIGGGILGINKNNEPKFQEEINKLLN